MFLLSLAENMLFVIQGKLISNMSPKHWVFAGISENQSKVSKFRMVS